MKRINTTDIQQAAIHHFSKSFLFSNLPSLLLFWLCYMQQIVYLVTATGWYLDGQLVDVHPWQKLVWDHFFSSLGYVRRWHWMGHWHHWCDVLRKAIWYSRLDIPVPLPLPSVWPGRPCTMHVWLALPHCRHFGVIVPINLICESLINLEHSDTVGPWSVPAAMGWKTG